MSYVALYRKWRPQTFDDVVGQEHIVTTLKNALMTDRLSHAYLFCGVRGTGKTSLAHILSRAANCTDLHEGNPCNKCPACNGIIEGSIMDVMEIDAASNNSVDNIRQLREDVVYAPVSVKHKVYIIDEVHMLSGGAFNALLKTLEEPPEYVIFILATTEPHKLPATILSRCQRFDFKRIAHDVITDRLKTILASMGINANDDALSLIVKLSGGSVRDAISIMDQCISAATFGELNRECVITTVGLVDDSFLCITADILLSRSVNSIYGHVNSLLSEGRDIKQYVQDLTGYFRNLMIIKFGADKSFFPEIQDDVYSRMNDQSNRAGTEWLITMISELSSFENALKNVLNPGIMLEVTLARLCLGQFRSDNAIEALNARISTLEHSLKEATLVASSHVQTQTPERVAAQTPEPAYTPAQRAEPAYTPAQVAEPAYTPAQRAEPAYTPAQVAEPASAQSQMADPISPQAQTPISAQTQLPTQGGITPQEQTDASIRLQQRQSTSNAQHPIKATAFSPTNESRATSKYIDEYTWDKTVTNLKLSEVPSIYAWLLGAKAYILDDKFYIILSAKSEPFVKMLNAEANHKLIRRIVNEDFKGSFDLKIITEKMKPPFLDKQLSKSTESVGRPINTSYANDVYPNGALSNNTYPNNTHSNGAYPNDVHPNGAYPKDIHPNIEEFARQLRDNLGIPTKII